LKERKKKREFEPNQLSAKDLNEPQECFFLWNSGKVMKFPLPEAVSEFKEKPPSNTLLK